MDEFRFRMLFEFLVVRLILLCLLSLGVLGIKVKIMLPWDSSGKNGPKKPLPDNVIVVEPKEDTIPVSIPKSDLAPVIPAVA